MLSAATESAKVQIDFDKRYVTSYRLMGYNDRAVADKDFTNDKVDGGEVGAGHSVTALDQFPGLVLSPRHLRAFVRMPADGTGIKQDIRPR